MTLELIEWAFNGSTFVAGGTLSLDPAPNSIEKMVKVEWKARHTGLYSIYPRCKYRYRKTVEFTLKGGCEPTKRREIEFYAARFSKFQIDNTSWAKMVSPTYYSERGTNPSGNPWTEENENQDLFLMLQEVTFTLEEGKNWCTYSIKLKVVNTEGITIEE